MLHNGVREIAPRAIANEAFVEEMVVVFEQAPVEDLRLTVIGIHPAKMDRPAQETIQARHRISRALWRRQRLPDFGGELRCAALVGIDAHHPIIRRGGEGKVAQFAKAAKFFADDARAVFLRDLDGAIGAERIDEHDFIRPLHAFEHGTNLRRLIEGERVSRDRRRGGHSFAAGWWMESGEMTEFVLREPSCAPKPPAHFSSRYFLSTPSVRPSHPSTDKSL